MSSKLKLISGSSCEVLTDKICQILGVPRTKITSQTFSNDNRFVRINKSVKGAKVFIIQTQLPPVDTYLMELLMLIRAAKDNLANRITVVLPYMPYSRSDKRVGEISCITARLVTDILVAAGANRAIVIDTHTLQIQSFFSIPCVSLTAAPILINHLKKNWNLDNYCLVASDTGASKMLTTYAESLNLPVAIIDKGRTKKDGEVYIRGIVGEVNDKKCLLLDDETSSGSTLIKGAEFLINKAGVSSVEACFIHAALSAEGVEKLNKSKIKRFVTTDTIPFSSNKLRDCEVASIAPLLAKCIKKIC